jgi:serine/threonine-protein kinase
MAGVARVAPADAFTVFDRQDSGCVSYGVERDGRKLFVKTAQTNGGRASMRRAIAFHTVVRHLAIVGPLDVVDTDDETTIIYPWCDGSVLNHATTAGSERAALDRFRRLPVDLVLAAIDTILDAHRTVAAAGFVSVDLYDGCFLYDFDRHVMRLVDLDEYRPGPFVLDADRLPGSRRYMAPEEFQRGGAIDERTTVFHMGRTIGELLGPERCSTAQQRVVDDATREEPENRLARVESLVRAWVSTRA